MNNFHIYEEIGKGKYSTVYKVISLTLGKEKKILGICCSKKYG